jgi:tRNA A-37 threonylcarbamoyl transferase component Bud32
VSHRCTISRCSSAIQAVGRLHTLDLVHGDLRLCNMVFCDADEDPPCVLLDYDFSGVAKVDWCDACW